MTTNVEKKEQREVIHTSPEQIVDARNACSPDVDIYSNDDDFSMILVADLPGVKKGDVSIDIDEKNTLIIRAKTSFEAPEGLVSHQFKVGNYYRAFTLSDEVDKDAISAKLEDGVLEVTIPKREELKPKHISISA